MSERAEVSIGLLDWFGEADRVIQSADWKLEDRDDSTNRLFVTTSLSEAEGVKSDQELIYRRRRFSVVDIDRERGDDTALLEADEVQAELADRVLVEYKPNSWSLEQAVEAALAGTRWTAETLVGTRYGRADFEDISVLEALQFIARHQDARLSFDSLRRRVSIVPDAGTTHETVFTYGRQLSNIQKTETAPKTTIIYPRGAEGLSVASLNGGRDYVEDYSYYTAQGISLADARTRFRKEDYWSDERYTVAENLLRDTEARLAVEAHPQIGYTLTVGQSFTLDDEGNAVTDPSQLDNFDLTTLALGDRVHVWDEETDTRILAEVTAITTSSDASESELHLAYLPPTLGASTEGRFFGDSGSPSDGPSGRSILRSGPQPRPSMPILESLSPLGVGVFRWNGQDHQGSFETIPERFGSVESVAAKIAEDGSIPSPNGPSAFGGSPITSRGGGISHVAFGEPGDYAVWFFMLGRDGQTRSLFSEPLTVEVPEYVDTEAIRAELNAAQARLNEAQAAADVALAEVRDLQREWEDVDFPALQQEISAAASAVEDANARLENAETELAQAATAVTDLRDNRIPSLEQSLSDGLLGVFADAEQRAQQLADSAVSQYAASAQTEFDRLDALAQAAMDAVESVGGGAQNALPNGGFSDLSGWYEYGDTLAPYDASLPPVVLSGRALRFGSGDSPIRLETQFPSALPSGRPVRVMGWVYCTIDGQRPGQWQFTGMGGLTTLLLGVSEPLRRGWNYVDWTTPAIPAGTDRFRIARIGAGAGGSAWFDDVFIFDAADVTPTQDRAFDARRVALEAKLQAMEVHQLAGDAAALAASAEESASRSNRIHWSLSAPTGTARDGDVWWRYTNLTGSSQRHVVQSWHWDAGVWREDQLAESYLPQVNIGSGTYGDLNGDRLGARSVTAEKVAIGTWEDMIPDPKFESGWWSGVHATLMQNSSIKGRAVNVTQARIDSLVGAGNFLAIRTQRFAAIPGASYTMSFESNRFGANSGGANDSYRVVVRILGTNGYIGAVLDVRDYATSSWQRHTHTFTIPNDANITGWDVEWRYDTVNGGNVWLAHPTMRQRFTGELLVDGSVGAQKIIANEIAAAIAQFLELSAGQIRSGTIDANRLNVDDLAARIATVIQLNANRITTGQLAANRININDLFANTAFVNSLRAAVVTALEVTADRGFIGGALLENGTIDVSKLSVTDTMAAQLFQAMEARIGDLAFNTASGMSIDAGRINTGTMTGRTVQTSSNIFAGSGGARMSSSSDGGEIEATYNGSRVFRAGRNGVFIDGDVTARSVALAGELRVGVGGNGEGGIIPLSDGKVRYIGRTPATTGPTDTVAYGRTSQITSPTSRTRLRITYETPTPSGARTPMLSIHRPEAAMEVVNAHSQLRSASNFEAIINSGANTAFWLYYMAWWGDPPNSPSSPGIG